MVDPEPPVTSSIAGGLRTRLYVSGGGPNSMAAIANLRAALADHPEAAAELEVIDVLEHPARAVSDRIFATPMLIKLEPAPERRILGSLNDRPALLAALGLEHR